MITYLRKLNMVLSGEAKHGIVVLLFLSVFLSVVETIGVSAIMPFISVASDPGLIERNKYYSAIYQFTGFRSNIEFITVFGIALILFYLFRAVLNLYFTYLLNKYTYVRFQHLGLRLFSNYIALPYRDFISKHLSALTEKVTSETVTLSGLVQHSLFFLSEVFTFCFIYAFLLFVNFKVTLALTLVLAAKVCLLTRATAKVMKKYGDNRYEYQTRLFKIVNEAFRNFKVIKLLSNEKNIFDSFREACLGYSEANTLSSTLVAVPRCVLEMTGFSIIVAAMIYIIYKQGSIVALIPLITIYVLALVRMLPSVSRMMSSYNNILFTSRALEVIHEDLLHKPDRGQDLKIDFQKSIGIINAAFSYSDEKQNVLTDLNVTIPKGARMAFIGESGSGKSTLLDLIMGVYRPSRGEIRIDDTVLSDANIRDWQRKIGYIPQSIYLFEDTVAQNVVFGRDYDEHKIVEVLRKANIYDFLASKEGLETKVGEGGVKLSEGQKQRIGIARALYGDPEVLVLDEATSALDYETEARIMQEIYDIAVDKTLLIVAHRLSTIQGCDTVYGIGGGQIRSMQTEVCL